MPLLTRVAIRFAMLWLATGLAVWFLGALRPEMAGRAFATATHAVTLGWLTQLVFGVAFWLFPKRKGVARGSRGGEAIGWAAVACLNLGVLTRLLLEPVAAPMSVSGTGLAFSAALQFASVCFFALMLRGRIRGK